MDWLLADAKNRFSEVVTLALTQGPQRVRRRNQTVVVLSEADYEQLVAPRVPFKDYLFNGPDFSELDLTREPDSMRSVTF
jgi:antitoxin Phd